MKVTILGCGGAGGVPLIGGNWGDCDPANPKNNRSRVSIKIEEGETTILVDTSPDLREQLLRAGLHDLTAVLYTHAHADHTHGIDNLRSINWLTGHSIPVYAGDATMKELTQRFGYIFDAPPVTNGKFIKPSVIPHIIEGPLAFGSIHVESFRQKHGLGFSRGYRFNDFGYSTDVKELNDAAFEALRGVKVWVVGAVREREHPTHANLSQVLAWIERVAPDRAYLTHMDHSMDYETIKSKLPPHVEPCYDGMVIEL